MTPEKPPENKHAIDSDNGLLAAEHLQAELLICYHRLGHLPFSNIKILDLLGIIPNRLANVNPPECEVFIYRAMTKHPWRTKEI